MLVDADLFFAGGRQHDVDGERDADIQIGVVNVVFVEAGGPKSDA